jgi:hypothetical protein
MARKLLFLALVLVFISACSFSSLQQTQPTQVIEPNPIQPTSTAACPGAATCPMLPTPLPPTVEPTNTSSPTQLPTNTSIPTVTPVPSETPIPKPYQVQPNNPIYLQNFAHSNLACAWLGVAGQVFTKSGKPLSGVVVVVDGSVSGQTLEQIGLTGKAPVYGDGGYELVLGNQAVASTSPLTISLYDLNGKALSDPFPFNSIADCKKNLILINFVAR